MLRPLTKAVSAQLAGIILVFGLGQSGIIHGLNLFWLAAFQGFFASITSMLLVSPRWWWPIHLTFLPSIVLTTMLQLPAYVYAGGFLSLVLIYWTSFRNQVPLFLSNPITVHRLAAWLPDETELNVLDVGSGTGSFVLRLARLRQDWQITGIETAPAPFALSRWLGRNTHNLKLLRANFWPHSFAGYNLVYAFLSPVPMPDLWRKARREMKPGSILISNSFAIPGVVVDTVLKLDDRRQTELFVYRIPGGKPLN